MAIGKEKKQKMNNKKKTFCQHVSTFFSAVFKLKKKKEKEKEKCKKSSFTKLLFKKKKKRRVSEAEMVTITRFFNTFSSIFAKQQQRKNKKNERKHQTNPASSASCKKNKSKYQNEPNPTASSKKKKNETPEEEMLLLEQLPKAEFHTLARVVLDNNIHSHCCLVEFDGHGDPKPVEANDNVHLYKEEDNNVPDDPKHVEADHNDYADKEEEDNSRNNLKPVEADHDDLVNELEDVNVPDDPKPVETDHNDHVDGELSMITTDDDGIIGEARTTMRKLRMTSASIVMLTSVEEDDNVGDLEDDHLHLYHRNYEKEILKAKAIFDLVEVDLLLSELRMLENNHEFFCHDPDDSINDESNINIRDQAKIGELCTPESNKNGDEVSDDDDDELKMSELELMSQINANNDVEVLKDELVNGKDYEDSELDYSSHVNINDDYQEVNFQWCLQKIKTVSMVVMFTGIWFLSGFVAITHD